MKRLQHTSLYLACRLWAVQLAYAGRVQQAIAERDVRAAEQFVAAGMARFAKTNPIMRLFGWMGWTS